MLCQAAEPSGPGFCHVRFFTYLSAANQVKQNHQWHGKGKYKICENHSFWRNISRERAVFPFCRSGYRQSTGSPMFVIRIPVQRDGEVRCEDDLQEVLRERSEQVRAHGLQSRRGRHWRPHRGYREPRRPLGPRDALQAKNANVRFHQQDTLERIFSNQVEEFV